MVDKRLISYVKKALEKSNTTKDIKNALLEKGWSSNDIDMAFQEARGGKVPAPRKAAYKEMGIFQKVGMILGSPNEFFQTIKSERGIGHAVTYLLILALIPTAIILVIATIASFLIGIFIGSFTAAIPGMEWFGLMLTFLGFFIAIGFYIGMLLASFVGGAIQHVFVYIFGGRNGFANTYKVTVYAMTPSLLLGWIPLIGLVFAIWTIYLTYKGYRVLHDMSAGRALGAIFTPFIIMFLVVMLGLFFFMGGFNPASYYHTTATGFSQIGLPDQGSWQMNSDGIFTLIIKNNRAEPIDMSSVTATYLGNMRTYSTPFTLRTVEERTVTFDFGPQLSGDSYSVMVEVTYTSPNGIEHFDSAYFTGIIQ